MPGRTRPFGAGQTSPTVGTATTRREAADLLSEAGVTGSLAEQMLRRTARHRHEWRADMAHAALRDAGEDGSDGYELPAALIVHLDRIGLGATGQATDRHPALQELGKGRKQASDGGAWTAAIEQAAATLPAIEVRPAMQDGVYGVLVHSLRDGDLFVPAGGPALPLRYALRLAEEAVATEVGVQTWVELPQLTGSVAQWSALYDFAWLAQAVDQLSDRLVNKIQAEVGSSAWDRDTDAPEWQPAATYQRAAHEVGVGLYLDYVYTGPEDKAGRAVLTTREETGLYTLSPDVWATAQHAVVVMSVVLDDHSAPYGGPPFALQLDMSSYPAWPTDPKPATETPEESGVAADYPLADWESDLLYATARSA